MLLVFFCDMGRDCYLKMYDDSHKHTHVSQELSIAGVSKKKHYPRKSKKIAANKNFLTYEDAMWN